MWHGLLTANFVGERHWVLEDSLTYELDERLSLDERDFWLWKNFGLLLNRKRVGSLARRREQVTITAPKGYDTDLASISRAIWSFISPWDVARAAVIHDILYGALRDALKNKTHGEKLVNEMRAAADRVFLEGMNHVEPAIKMWKAKPCYWSVRPFGRFAIRKAGMAQT